MNETAITAAQTDAAALEPKAQPFPGIVASIIWIILFFALQVMGIFVVGIYALTTKILAGGDPANLKPDEAIQMIGGIPLIWSLVASSLLTLFLLWLYLRKNDRMAAIGLNQWSQISLKTTVFLAAFWCSAAIVFNYLYETYAIPGVKLQDDLRMLFDSIPATIANRTLLFVTIAILAPAVEELLFRGLLQKSLSKHLPIAAAIGISAAIFGAMHLDLYAFPALFVMGAVFGYIYYRTGSLRVNIALHMINNGAALILSWVLPS